MEKIINKEIKGIYRPFTSILIQKMGYKSGFIIEYGELRQFINSKKLIFCYRLGDIKINKYKLNNLELIKE